MPGLDREFKARQDCIAKIYFKIKEREEEGRRGGKGGGKKEERAKLKNLSASSV